MGFGCSYITSRTEDHRQIHIVQVSGSLGIPGAEVHSGRAYTKVRHDPGRTFLTATVLMLMTTAGL
jgi:hypothetical protein